MPLDQSLYGRTSDGTTVDLITLSNANGLRAGVMSYGASLVRLITPDRSGQFADITLGFDSLPGWLGEHPYFGATVGRYANRIARGEFRLDGKDYKLALNEGPNHLHGGKVGFDKVVWREQVLPGDEPSVTFRYTSPHGEQGFPGTLEVEVTYRLNDANELVLEYVATTDRPTVVNLSHHTYWNLSGHDAGDVLDHVVRIHADRFTPSGKNLVPTGEIAEVRGTPMDFRSAGPLGERIGQLDNGFDVNFVLGDKADSPRPAARIVDPKTGRSLEMLTTEPGMQFYTGNFLDGRIAGKGGHAYPKHAGICLEAQHFPDAPNQPNFPSPVLRPGEIYRQTTIYRFGIEE